MPVPVGTVQTYTRVGNREDLSDVIYNISPSDTPFMSAIGRGSASAVSHEWQTDALAAPDLNNAFPQGDDVVFSAPTPTIRVRNFTQISREQVIVSGTQEAVQKAGRKSEKGYLMAKKGKELRNSIKAILLSNQGALAGSSAVAARLGALGAWIRTNTSEGVGGTDPVYTDTPTDPRDDGTPRPFTEALLKAVIMQCYMSGGEPSLIMVGAFNKQVASTFDGIATKTYQQTKIGESVTIAAADIYVSDFGTMTFVPNRRQRPRDAWIIDPEMVEVAYLRPFFKKALGDTGDSMREALIVEYTLKVSNEAAHGLVADLTTA